MAEMPHLVKVASEFESEGGRVIAISEDLFVPRATRESALEKVKKAVAARGMKFPVLILEEKNLDGLNERFDLPGPIPCTIAFDKDGKEVDRAEEGADEARLREMFLRALGKKPPVVR